MRLWNSSKAEKADAEPAGIHTSLSSLIALAGRAKGFGFRPRQPSHSILAGRHASKLRGRGLDFEELRNYLPGDDIRSIDWKVTARTSKPYVRVYTEERDRPAILVVDQRQDMFFGSVRNMKSVTAAETAALAAWRIVGSGDRVGAVVFDDSTISEIRPHRSKSTVLRILHAIEERNLRMRADSPVKTNAAMLNQALTRASGLLTQSHLLLLITDFDGVDEQTELALLGMALHNDVVACMVYDPMRTQLPEPRDFVVTDGELQVELTMGNKTVRERVVEVADARARRVLAWESQFGIPVLPLSTGEDTADQIRRLLGSRKR